MADSAVSRGPPSVALHTHGSRFLVLIGAFRAAVLLKLQSVGVQLSRMTYLTHCMNVLCLNNSAWQGVLDWGDYVEEAIDGSSTAFTCSAWGLGSLVSMSTIRDPGARLAD